MIINFPKNPLGQFVQKLCSILQYIAVLQILQYYEGVLLHDKISISQWKCPFREMGNLDPI